MDNGSNLKELRMKRGLTLACVAKELSDKTSKNIAYQNIQELENDKRKIPYKWLIPLSELYECTIDELVKGVD